MVLYDMSCSIPIKNYCCIQGALRENAGRVQRCWISRCEFSMHNSQQSALGAMMTWDCKEFQLWSVHLCLTAIGQTKALPGYTAVSRASCYIRSAQAASCCCETRLQSLKKECEIPARCPHQKTLGFEPDLAHRPLAGRSPSSSASHHWRLQMVALAEEQGTSAGVMGAAYPPPA